MIAAVAQYCGPAKGYLGGSSGGTLGSMKQVSFSEILELPVPERIRLVELIWDSIAAVPEALPVPDDLKAELDRRLSDFEANPEAGSPWEEVRERVLQGTWRTG